MVPLRGLELCVCVCVEREREREREREGLMVTGRTRVVIDSRALLAMY